MKNLDNPYQTVLQFARLDLVRGKGTVIESFRNLKEMLNNSPTVNKVADERVSKVIEYMETTFMEDQLLMPCPKIQVNFYQCVEAFTNVELIDEQLETLKKLYKMKSKENLKRGEFVVVTMGAGYSHNIKEKSIAYVVRNQSACSLITLDGIVDDEEICRGELQLLWYNEFNTIDLETFYGLKQLRKDLGLSIRQTAKLCGVSKSTLHRMENGKQVGKIHREKLVTYFKTLMVCK